MDKLAILYFFFFILFSCPVYSHEIPVVQSTHVIKLGSGWATNTINTVIFRHHGVITSHDFQFTSFYDFEGNMKLVRRNLITNDTDHYIMPGEFDLFDAHNSISLGIDRLGYLHISFDHHGHELRYRRSKKPLSIDSWTEMIPMTGQREHNVTYPAFIFGAKGQTKSPLLFLYRDGRYNKGDACLKEYDEQSLEWKDRNPCVLSGSQQSPWTSNAYWNHPVIDHNGRMHLSFVWRTHPIGPEKRINNINVDYAFSDDFGYTWRSSLGREMKTPVTQVNSETVWAVSPGSNLINQAGMAVDSKGRPHIVFYSDDFDGIAQYQHLWFDGKSWQHHFISERKNPFVLAGGGSLQIPISRPEVIIDKQDSVYVIFRGDLTDNKMAAQRLLPPDYKPCQSELKLLWPDNLEYAEPVIDRVRWSTDGLLTMLIQRNGQPPHDKGGAPRSEPVYLVDWNITKAWND